jgi:hypothetical protein
MSPYRGSGGAAVADEVQTLALMQSDPCCGNCDMASLLEPTRTRCRHREWHALDDWCINHVPGPVVGKGERCAVCASSFRFERTPDTLRCQREKYIDPEYGTAYPEINPDGWCRAWAAKEEACK